jgi:G3E family GTPase
MVNDSPEGMDAIPVTIVAGYVGAGKTTLINHLVGQSAGRRLAVVVNDFGSTDVDQEVIAEHGGAAVSLANGCVCCTRTTELLLALAGLRSRPLPPHQILIEADSVSDPGRIAEAVGLHGLRHDSTVVIADAEAVRTHAADRVIGGPVRHQLAAADLVVLNKTDLVTQVEKSAVCDWISELVPTARVVETSYGRVPVPLVLAEDESNAPARVMGLRDPSAADLEYASWAWAHDKALDEPAFRWWAANLPEGTLRGEGVLYLEGDPLHRHVFHLVGSRWTLERDALWGKKFPRSHLVLIGRTHTLDPLWLDMMIARCVAHHHHVGVSA